MNQNTNKTKENIKTKMPLILRLIIICVFIVFLIMFIPLINSIFSKNSFIHSLTSLLTITNNLGGTIGGILGPIVALMAALLTYWAFMEQVKANNLQFAEINRARYNERFALLLSIHRDNVEKLESKEKSFKDIFNEFKFIYLVIQEQVENDIEVRKNLIGQPKWKIRQDRDFKFEDIINISLAVLIFGLDSVYDTKSETDLKIRTESDSISGYIHGLNRLTELIDTDIEKVEYVTYFCFYYQQDEKKHSLKISNNSFKGYGRELENYFNNLDILLKFICTYLDESDERKNIDYFESSITILESQLTLHEVLLLYFYGKSIISNTFGNLFLNSNLISTVLLSKIDFSDTITYPNNGSHIPPGMSRYSHLFK